MERSRAALLGAVLLAATTAFADGGGLIGSGTRVATTEDSGGMIGSGTRQDEGGGGTLGSGTRIGTTEDGGGFFGGGTRQGGMLGSGTITEYRYDVDGGTLHLLVFEGADGSSATMTWFE